MEGNCVAFYDCLEDVVVFSGGLALYLLEVGECTHSVVRVAAEENSVDVVVFL